MGPRRREWNAEPIDTRDQVIGELEAALADRVDAGLEGELDPGARAVDRLDRRRTLLAPPCAMCRDEQVREGERILVREPARESRCEPVRERAQDVEEREPHAGAAQ